MNCYLVPFRCFIAFVCEFQIKFCTKSHKVLQSIEKKTMIDLVLLFPGKIVYRPIWLKMNDIIFTKATFNHKSIKLCKFIQNHVKPEKNQTTT